MMNFRTTSVATAIVVFLTSFTPSQAFALQLIECQAKIDRAVRSSPGGFFITGSVPV